MAWGWDQREPAERLVGAGEGGRGRCMVAGTPWGAVGCSRDDLGGGPRKLTERYVKSVVVGCCRFIFRLQCRKADVVFQKRTSFCKSGRRFSKADVVFRGELTNHPAGCDDEGATMKKYNQLNHVNDATIFF